MSDKFESGRLKVTNVPEKFELGKLTVSTVSTVSTVAGVAGVSGFIFFYEGGVLRDG